jgi:hypothetical protein
MSEKIFTTPGYRVIEDSMGVTTVVPDGTILCEYCGIQYLNQPSDLRIAQLEAELKESNAETAACLAFLSTEMGWEYFRADQLYLDHEPANSQSLNNAEKLRKYLAEKKHGAEFLRSYAAIESDAKLAELRKDKERLDWLWSNGRIDVSDDDGRLSSREAIDAAMGEKAEGR